MGKGTKQIMHIACKKLNKSSVGKHTISDHYRVTDELQLCCSSLGCSKGCIVIRSSQWSEPLTVGGRSPRSCRHPRRCHLRHFATSRYCGGVGILTKCRWPTDQVSATRLQRMASCAARRAMRFSGYPSVDHINAVTSVNETSKQKNAHMRTTVTDPARHG